MTDNYSDEKNTIPLNIFWLGFLIYIFSYLIAQSDKVSYALCNVFQIIGLLMFIPSAVFLIRFKVENRYLGSVYILFLLWSAGVFLRGISFDYDSVKRLLFRPDSGIFLYLLPLVLLFPRGPVFFKKVFNVVVILGVIYLILCLIFIKDLLIAYSDVRSQSVMEYFTQHLSLPSGFLLLTFIYHSAKRKWFAIFIIVISFVLAVLRARRGLMFITFNIMFFAYLIYQYVNKTKVINIILSIFIIILVSAIAVKIYNDNRKGTFSLITERMGQQTRSEVEQYFFSDLKSKDWVIGKGINGQYFCPGVTEGVGRVSIYRRVIETGYLQVILNGGIISLGLLLLIAIPAIFKGLFYSKNVLSKTAAIWIFLFLLYMYPGTLTIFSMHYILVWISIGICFSNELRNMSDSRILEILNRKKINL